MKKKVNRRRFGSKDAAESQWNVHNVWIFSKPGLPLFSKIVGSIEVPKELVGGAFTGIGNLTGEMGLGNVSTMVSDLYNVVIFSGQHTNGVLVVDRDDDLRQAEESIAHLVQEFEGNYAKEIAQWDGRQGIFDDFPEYMHQLTKQAAEDSIRAYAYQVYQKARGFEDQIVTILEKTAVKTERVFKGRFDGLDMVGQPKYTFTKTIPYTINKYWNDYIQREQVGEPFRLEFLADYKDLKYRFNPFTGQTWGIPGEGTQRAEQTRHQAVPLVATFLQSRQKLGALLEHPPDELVRDQTSLGLRVIADVHILHHANYAQQGMGTEPDHALRDGIEAASLPIEKTWELLEHAVSRARLLKAIQDAIGEDPEFQLIQEIKKSKQDTNSFFWDADTFNYIYRSTQALEKNLTRLEDLLKAHDGKFLKTTAKRHQGLRKRVSKAGILDGDGKIVKKILDDKVIKRSYEIFFDYLTFLAETRETVTGFARAIETAELGDLPISLQGAKGRETVLKLLENYAKRCGATFWAN